MQHFSLNIIIEVHGLSPSATDIVAAVAYLKNWPSTFSLILWILQFVMYLFIYLFLSKQEQADQVTFRGFGGLSALSRILLLIDSSSESQPTVIPPK